MSTFAVNLETCIYLIQEHTGHKTLTVTVGQTEWHTCSTTSEQQQQ